MGEGHVGFIVGVLLGGCAMWATPWAFVAVLAITAGVHGWDYWDHRRVRKARESAPRRKDLG
jgi:hypothetical protein